MKFTLLVAAALLAGCGCTTKAKPPKAPKPKPKQEFNTSVEYVQSYATQWRNGVKYHVPQR